MKLIARLLAPYALPLLFFGCMQNAPSDFHGTLLNPPMEIANFAFVSGDGPIQLSDFAGKYIILAFGYTYCPDACPTTMARLAKVNALLEDKADQVQVLLISIDPARDTPEGLQKYTANFNERFKGVVTSEQDAEALFKKFGIYHAVSDSTSTENYLIDHSTSTLVLNRDGDWQLVWNFELTPDEMAADLLKLIHAR